MRIVIFLILLLLFCSNDSNISGGTSTETTNGITIISSTQTAVNNAIVLIIDKSRWYERILNGESPVTDTLHSDETGFVQLDSNMSTQAVQIIYKDESAILYNQTDTVILSKGNNLCGRANGNTNIYISGTAYSAESQSNDSFYIENVPSGIYSLYSDYQNSLPQFSRIKLDTVESIQIINEDTSLLFDDFLGGFDGNPLASVTSGLYWYTFSDYKNSHYSNSQWTFTNEDGTGKSTVTPQALDGKVRFDIFLDSTSDGSYAGMGASVQGSSKYVGYNLSDMSGFRLKMNGTGTIAFFFKSVLVDSVNEELSDKISHYHVKIDLEEIPIDTTFQISDLHMETEDIQEEKLYPWSECSKNIKVIQINYRTKENEGNKDYWFELDEIRFIGVNLPL